MKKKNEDHSGLVVFGAFAFLILICLIAFAIAGSIGGAPI